MYSKKNISTLLLFFGIYTAGYSIQKDSLGLPGDNLDLYSVMELFKKSENPEAFEAALNKEDNKVNNLDLNGDGEIDYIRVVDHVENDVHALVLQVPINETEVQDVAVIEIEKRENETANVQIVGDEYLYGKNYIVEPIQESQAVSPPPPPQQEVAGAVPPPVIVNVWTWPGVRYVYGKRYTVWASPWRWRYYPGGWKPWRPYNWNTYYGYVNPYHTYHHRVYVCNVVRAHTMYRANRVVSKTVYQRRMPAPAQSVRREKRMEGQRAPRAAKANRQGRGQRQPRQHNGPRR